MDDGDGLTEGILDQLDGSNIYEKNIYTLSAQLKIVIGDLLLIIKIITLSIDPCDLIACQQ